MLLATRAQPGLCTHTYTHMSVIAAAPCRFCTTAGSCLPVPQFACMRTALSWNQGQTEVADPMLATHSTCCNSIRVAGACCMRSCVLDACCSFACVARVALHCALCLLVRPVLP